MKPLVTPKVMDLARIRTVQNALGIPEHIDVDLNKLDTDSLVEFVAAMESQLATSSEVVKEALLPIRDITRQARDKILSSIPGDAKEHPHSTFIVKKEQRTEREKRIADIWKLQGKIPDDEFNSMVYIKAITGPIDPHIASEAEKGGAKVVWEMNLVKADAIGRKYGGEIKKVIEEASPRSPVGEPYLIIEPREKGI